MPKKFYITGKGFDRATQVLNDPESHHQYKDGILTFIATSQDMGIDAKLFHNELGDDDGVSLDEIEQHLNELHDEKLVTVFKGNRCKRADKASGVG